MEVSLDKYIIYEILNIMFRKATSLLEQPATRSLASELSTDTRAKIVRTEAPYLSYMDSNHRDITADHVKKLATRAYATGMLAAVTHNLLLPKNETIIHNINLLEKTRAIISREFLDQTEVREDVDPTDYKVFPVNIATVGGAIALLVAQNEKPVDIPTVARRIDRDRSMVSRSMLVLRLEGALGEASIKQIGSKSACEPLIGFTSKLLNNRSWRSQLYLLHTAQQLGMDAGSARDLLVEEGYHPSIAQTIADKQATRQS